MKLKELKKKKVAILGFGKEGKSSLNFLLLKLHHKNIGVFDDEINNVYEFTKFLVDTKKSFDLFIEKKDDVYIGKVKFISEGKIFKIHFHFGKYHTDKFETYSVILKSPGISPYQEKYEKIRNKFTSQTEIFYSNYKGKIIGITGTKGKSTTTTLIYNGLKNAGLNVKIVGNIGNPVFDEIDITQKVKYDFVVYEMSSYMLDNFHPKNYISLFNNIFTCHLEWHKTWENYLASKCNIIKKAKYAFVNNGFQHLFFDRKNTTFFGREGKYSFDKKSFLIDNKKVLSESFVHIPGEHNLENIAGVLGVLHRALKSKTKATKILQKTLENFKGLPHRLENIGTFRGITFINDAIAVTPEATIAAINSFPGKVDTIFLGGKEAGYNFTDLEKKIVNEKIKNVVLFPDALIYDKIAKNLEENQEQILEIDEVKILFLKTKSMKSAVQFAYRHTQNGKIALLSCAAQSFSLWKNFEIKGDEFKKCVQELS